MSKKIDVKKVLLYIVKAVVVWICLMALTLGFMTLSKAIPKDSAMGARIMANAESSLGSYVEDLESPIFHESKWYQHQINDDMMFVNVAITETDYSAFNEVVGIYMHSVEGDDKEGCINSLVSAIYYNDDYSNLITYSRFYMLTVFILRVLLIFFDIQKIRFILYYTAVTLAICITCKLYSLYKWKGVLPFVTACALRLVVLQSFTFATFYDMVCGLFWSLFILLFYEKKFFKDNELIIFGVIGMYAYINCVFYAPMFTLGMPLVTSILVKDYSDKNLSDWLNIFFDSVSWVIGYASALFFKQILCLAVFGGQTASEELKYMMGLDMTLSERLEMIGYNYLGLLEPLGVKIPILLIILIVLLVQAIRNGVTYYKSTFQLLVLALYPVVWITIICRHSLHNFVSNITAITVYALLSLFTLSIKEKDSLTGN